MIKIGNGYDIHRLVPDRDFILGGFKIPFHLGLLGHSDGDVLIHSIIDSILGACGFTDIGTFFPDNDPKYKNISSKILLQMTMETIRDFKILNIDNIIICEKPKLRDYVEEMKKSLDEILKIGIKNIGVKSKTSEGLGLIGQYQAVEVYTVCLVEL